MAPGTLYLVATPIGNLGDITQRALEVLRAVPLVVCEDTRHSRGLFSHFRLSKETWSLPAFAEGERAGRVLDRLEAGEDVALVTDAGSPGISDPGETLVAQALERGIPVTPIPGPAALIAALSASGLPSARFHFLGFLPRKGGDRSRLLEEVSQLRATLVLYESPRRLVETLEDLQALWGNRRACVARELTKLHEEFLRGTLTELHARLSASEVLGEVVLLVEGRVGEVRWTEEEVRTALGEGLSRGEKLKPLSKDIAAKAGWSGADVYKLGLVHFKS